MQSEKTQRRQLSEDIVAECMIEGVECYNQGTMQVSERIHPYSSNISVQS